MADIQEAIQIIKETKKASASYLQQRMKIGYNEAARILEELERRKIIGKPTGSRPREVFI